MKLETWGLLFKKVKNGGKKSLGMLIYCHGSREIEEIEVKESLLPGAGWLVAETSNAR